MTQATYAPTSLEVQAQRIGQRFSRTQAEREQIAADIDALVVAYELQGGRYALKWVERHVGLSHGTAFSMVAAGYALRHHAPRGGGVSHLSTLGRLMKRGHSLTEAQAIAADQKARQEAAQQANIGVGKVKYPTALTGEMANSYATLATSLSDAGLPAQDVPELTVTMTRLAMTNLQPYQLRALELGEAISTQPKPEKVRTDFFPWLARQPCAACGEEGPCQIHHLRTPDIDGQVGGRRFKHSQAKELVVPLCMRCHLTARDAAHRQGQDEWSAAKWGRPDAAFLLAARYLSAWAEEQGLLRGEKV